MVVLAVLGCIREDRTDSGLARIRGEIAQGTRPERAFPAESVHGEFSTADPRCKRWILAEELTAT
jgi:hypothetical protein